MNLEKKLNKYHIKKDSTDKSIAVTCHILSYLVYADLILKNMQRYFYVNMVEHQLMVRRLIEVNHWLGQTRDI